MNILKTTPKGMVIITKVAVHANLCDKFMNCGSYHMKMIKKQCDKIASWEICDNDINPNDEAFPKMIKLTSVEFSEVDADFVSVFANSQEHLLTEIVKAEAAGFRIEQASNIANEMFKNMLDTNFVDLQNEEN
jgi:hypothetical protein